MGRVWSLKIAGRSVPCHFRGELIGNSGGFVNVYVAIGIIVLLLMAVGAGVALYFSKRETNPEVLASAVNVNASRAALKDTEKARNQHVKAAKKSLDGATKQRERAIKQVMSEIAALQDPKGKKIASYQGVTLHEYWIGTPHGSGSVAGMQASVDSQPSSRITATRLIAIGIFALAARKQTGKVYLSIDGPELVSVVECPHDQNRNAREFAVKIGNAGRAATAAAQARPGQLARAKSALVGAQDTTAVDAFRKELAAAEADERFLEPIRTARAALTVVEKEHELVKAAAAGAGPAAG